MNGSQRTANRALGRRLALVVLAMFGFGFLLVPFYEKICEVAGINRIGRSDSVAGLAVDTGRVVRVELDGNLRNLPWRFSPREPLLSAHPGELIEVVYDVTNTGDRPLVGQAVPSYAPAQAASYFRKLDCFCFTAQALAPGERREMPVVFVIDPGLPRDIATITLSYTFFEVEGAARVASRAGTGGSK